MEVHPKYLTNPLPMTDDKRRAYQQQYKADYRRRTARVNLTLDREEHRAFLRGAKRAGMKPTPFIKQMALAGLSGQAVMPADVLDELKTLRFAILNIANNVNQIAHHANSVHHLTTNEEHNLLSYLKQLDDVVKAYTEGRIMDAAQEASPDAADDY